MPWKTVKGNRYYCSKTRVNGREVWRYVGSGFLGELAEVLDQEEAEEARVRTEAQRQERRRIDDLDRTLDALDRIAGMMARAALEVEGLRWSARGKWTRSGMSTATEVKTIPDSQPPSWTGRAKFTELTARGLADLDPEAIVEIHGLLNELAAREPRCEADYRFVIDKFGNIPMISRDFIYKRYRRSVLPDLMVLAIARCKALDMAKELAGPEAPLGIKLVADRAAFLFARLHLEELSLDQVAGRVGDRESAARERRIERLNRQWLGAMRSLEQVRRLLRPRGPALAIQVNNVVNEGGEKKTKALVIEER